MKTRLLTLAFLASLAVSVTIDLSETSPTTAQSTMSGSHSPVSQMGERSDLPKANLELPPVIIRGQVAGGQAGLRVQVLASDGGVVDETRTGPSGGYRFTPLLSGHYTLRVLGERGQLLALTQNAQVETWLEQAQARREHILPLAAPIPVGEIRSPEHSLAPMSLAQPVVVQATGQITGVVTAADTGVPLPGVEICAYPEPYQSCYGLYYTDATGAYTATGLSTGNYKVEFYSPEVGPSVAYLSQYYNNKPDLATADIVSVTAPNVVRDINVALTRGGEITGRVTAADTGLPLEGVDIEACDCYGSCFLVNSASTNAAGVYTVPRLLTGSYKVKFSPPSSGSAAAYLSQYYNNKSTWETADGVDVTVSSVVNNINAVLARGGQITGRVTAADGGAGLSGVYVWVYDASTGYEVDQYGSTDATGVYTIGLPTGSYKLQFSPSSYGASLAYVRQYYNGKPDLASADVINVTAPNVVSNINQTLARGGQITGRVTVSDTHSPVQWLYVGVYDGNGSRVGSSSTNASGVYTTTGLPTGSYRVEFRPGSTSAPGKSYLRQYYNNKPTLALADAISVTAPNLVSNIDVALECGGQIVGTVTAADTGLPLQAVRGIVINSSGIYVESFRTFGRDNYFFTIGLPTGDYRLWFFGTNIYGSGCSVLKSYAWQYYNNKPDLASADVVHVTAPNVTSINAILALSSGAAPVTGVTISGPATGYEQTSYTFNAAVSPVTATTPITYVWQAAGQSPVTHTGRGVSDSASFTWSTAGSKTITVTASNAQGAASNVYTINISGPQAPTGVTISGPTVGFTQTSLMFNATVSPITATTPITYIWQAAEQSAVTHTGGSASDNINFTWATTGTKAITVTASNALGGVTGNYAVNISSVQYRVYLPLVMKTM